MNRLRYDTSGLWLKGNTHIHTTASDGGKTTAEVAAMYASRGYDFLFRTDHWAPSDSAQDPQQYPVLWLDGLELDGEDHTGGPYHVVCLGRVKGVKTEDGFEAALLSAHAQGAMLVLAHPRWTGTREADCLRWPFAGVEVYNHVCHWLNGKSDGLTFWDVMLKANPNTLAFASDDAHIRPEHPGWDGGWIMVNVAERSAPAIMAAIRRGNYYSSCGPEFHSIAAGQGEVRVRTSPVQFVRVVGPGSAGRRVGSFDGQVMSEAVLAFPETWEYVYVEIEDREGRRAWTNTLVVADPSLTPAPPALK